ncbi:hypothetical protein ABZ609_21185 [Streptomyces rubiginosohelvolus]|uniref:hypothetical protein n=1 Tax=Streptomyces rubiginosohelvolus TaxID=67362 RepID=UPI0033DD84CB
MTGTEAHGVIEAISQQRFQPYLDDCKGDQAAALRLYAWDGEIARAFHGPLRDLEVSLRNRLHRQLVGRYGRDDWWHAPRVRLSRVSENQVLDAEESLQRKRGNRFGPDDMVAKLMFGFWVGLLGTSSNYEYQFWQPALRHCFRGYTGRRGPLQKEFESVRLFRNRIAHHERICHRSLEDDFRTVVELTRYLSPETAARHEKYSQVPDVLARRTRVLCGDEEIRL